MKKVTRRDFFKLAGSSALSGLSPSIAFSATKGRVRFKQGGEDFSPDTHRVRKSIPSACWQCVSRDATLCFLEDDRLVKIEGNPKAIRNRGKICSKGQAGINQVYDPDRILYPFRRRPGTPRGGGQWERISWEEAYGDLIAKLQPLLDKGEPEKFMFHYGRMKGSDSKIVKSCFLAAFGTKTIGNHTSICESAKWTGQELTWGKHYDINDVEHSKMVLNFGCNFYEAHTSHIQLSQRMTNAQMNGAKLYTFDVRLSNTAAKSDEWLPVKPGTDLPIILAMSKVIMDSGLYDADFINKWTNVTPQQIKEFLNNGNYTPQWAENLSGVPASKIKNLAIQFATIKPSTLISYRGAVAHYHGADVERAAKMLDAICGNINNRGGTNLAVGAKWKYPKPKHPPKSRKLKVIDGVGVSLPTHHTSHMVLRMIKEAPVGKRPEVYMHYCYEPVFANGNMQENIDILKDEKIIPYVVSVNPFYSEGASLADLILPDVTYLERWSWDDMVSYELIPEYYLRQPVVKPLGECRQFQDVCIELAKRLKRDGKPLDMGGYSSTVDFIKKSCVKTSKKLGQTLDFNQLVKDGVWVPQGLKPKYNSHAKALSLTESGSVIFDIPTGVFWDWKKSKAKSVEEARVKGYTKTKNAYKGYRGQKFNHGIYLGFKPDKVNKSGKFEIYSEIMKDKGLNPWPVWEPIPEHKNMKPDELILTSFKVTVQSHSRTQNCKWLTELYHDNPAWVNTATAKRLGLSEGDAIEVTQVKKPSGKSSYTQPVRKSIQTKVHVTEAIHPGTIGIAHHLGHWEYGLMASGKKAVTGHTPDEDKNHKWWKEVGVRPNWIMPNAPDPISGQIRMSDTVVTVRKS